MKFVSKLRSAFPGDAKAFLSFIAVIAAVSLFPEMASAQSGGAAVNPFASATTAADKITTQLKTFALAVGGIGMISCLMLGFFGKLNWKWVATGIGVSIGIAIVVPSITWLSTLA